jgi:hypothetical protein
MPMQGSCQIVEAALTELDVSTKPSSRRRPGSIDVAYLKARRSPKPWIPAFAGMTAGRLTPLILMASVTMVAFLPKN